MPRCPVCGELVTLEETPTRPFCSPRCRQVDLGRWLDERYSLPVESDDEPESEDEDRGQEEGGP
jgi:endogenous inhibitor of DNA gyrase (YacG/DUF329 family)